MARKAAESSVIFGRFGQADDDIEEWPTPQQRQRRTLEPVQSAVSAVDLTDRPKMMFGIGRGGAGKTTFLRWVTEKLLERGSAAAVAALDPANRSLPLYFENVLEPDSYAPAAVKQWLEDFLAVGMESKGSAVLDMGGGDTSLLALVEDAPGIADMLEESGVTPIAAYLLTPSPESLTPMIDLEAAGFRPKATALILNDGLGSESTAREKKFRDVLRHSAFRAAVDRGAVPLWLPRLQPAQEVLRRRITYAQARDGVIPDGRKMSPLGPVDRLRVRAWLQAVEAEMAPIMSWIP